MSLDILSTFEKVSKIIVLPVLILYILGFIVINSFTSEFGIITFDMTSSRYVYAGLFPALFIIASYINANFINTSLYVKRIHNRGILKRVGFYVALGFLFYMSSHLLDLLLSSNDYLNGYKGGKWQDLKLIAFNDTVNALLEKRTSHLSESHCVVIKNWLFTMQLFAAITLIIFFAASPLYIYDKFIKTKLNSKDAPTKNNTDNTTVKKELGSGLSFFIIIDFIFISFYVAVIIFSNEFILSNTVNILNIDRVAKIDSDIILAWIYEISWLIFFFILAIEQYKDSGLSEMLSTFAGNLSLLNNISFSVIPVFISLFVYGIVIFPRVPLSLGGGIPVEIEITPKVENYPLRNVKLFLIGEDQKYLFIVADDGASRTAIRYSKDDIRYVKTVSEHRQE